MSILLLMLAIIEWIVLAIAELIVATITIIMFVIDMMVGKILDHK